MSKYYRSGQFELIKLRVITNTESPIELDMGNAWVELILFESIFDPCMSGTLSFVDTNNYADKYALGNGDRVQLEFITAGSDISIDYEGIVYDLTGPARINDHASAYTLHFTSPIAFNNTRYRAFDGYKTEAHNIINAMYGKISEGKKAIFTETKYVEHYVCVGEHPLSVIKKISKFAVSTRNDYGYFFYENNKEFRFAPLTELYAQPPAKTFFYSSQPAYDFDYKRQEEAFDQVQDFELEEPIKVIEKIKGGMFGSTTRHIELTTKKEEINEYTPDLVFTKKLGNSPFLKKLDDNLADKVSISYDVVSRQSKKDIEKNRLIANKSLELVANIGVYGDSGIRAGHTCIANIPSYYKDDFSPADVDVRSGKFLIAEIKHKLTPKQYNQRIMIIKDSYEEEVA